MRTRTFLLTLTLFALLPPAASAQKGALGLGANPYEGVASSDGHWRYVTVPSGDGTIVERIEIGTGEIDQLRVITSGAAAIPAVAFDGTPGGLSSDGSTLVMPQPAWRFPQHSSHFYVLDGESLKLRDPVKLDGTWTFDALSPDGRWLYLIEYTSPRDISEYAVRAYDLRERRLDPEPVVDPEEPGEEMYGTPLTRETSVDGRWAYTLYEPAERHHPPFIHALDTTGRTAVCIDLDALQHGARPWRLGLEPTADGTKLYVTERGEPVLNVDLDTFEVGDAAVSQEPTADADEVSEGGGLSIAILLTGAAALVAGAGILARRRHN